MSAKYKEYIYSGSYVEQRRMDIFLPDSPNGSCLLFIHGGGWSAGKKGQWHSVAEHFCSLGFVCASTSYRLVPSYIFPSQIEDVRLAMQYLKKESARFGFNKDSIAVIGSSAGGYLAAMLGMISENDELGITPELLMKDTRPKAVVCYCPVLDLFTGRESAHKFLGGTPEEIPDVYRTASPEFRIDDDLPPYLFLQGNDDPTTTLRNTSRMCHKINESGGIASIVVLPGIKHGFGYGTSSPAQQQSIKHMELFLDRHGF